MTFGQFIALLAALIFLVVLVAALRKLSGGGEGPLPYFSRQFLLSRGETVFYHTLQRALPPHLIICPKVRLGDILNCSGEAWKEGYGGRISQKHVDFVLADVESTAIALIIELDDRTHRRADRVQRDDFLDRALTAAGVAMLRVPAAAAYDVRTLRNQISELVKDISAVAASPR